MLIAWLLLACRADPEPAPTTPPAPVQPQPTAPSHPEPVLPTLTVPDTAPTGQTGATGHTGDTGGPPEAGAWLFEDDAVLTFTLTLTPEAQDRLRTNPDEWAPASLIVGSYAFPLVGVRLKGNGSFQSFDDKPSWKVDIDHYVDGLELDGLDEIVLDNMGNDPTWLRAKTANALYAQMGVPAPRSTWVTLKEGDRTMAMLLSEDKDGRFLDRWYDDGDGSLYELFDSDLYVEQIPFLDHDNGPMNLAPFYAVAGALDATGARLSRDTDHVLDVEQFARYFGISGAIGQFDAYPYSNPGDDIYFYIDPADNRIDTLPHGTDETFTDRFRPADFTIGRLGGACLADPVCKQWWGEDLWEAVDHVAAHTYDDLRAGHDLLIERYGELGYEDCNVHIDAVKADHDDDGVIEDATIEAAGVMGTPCRSMAAMITFVLTRYERVSVMPGVPDP